MSEIAPRQASLRLSDLSTPQTVNREAEPPLGLATYRSPQSIDDMNSFDSAEEVRVGNALSAATSGFPIEMAIEVQAGFKRGYVHGEFAK